VEGRGRRLGRPSRDVKYNRAPGQRVLVPVCFDSGKQIRHRTCMYCIYVQCICIRLLFKPRVGGGPTLIQPRSGVPRVGDGGSKGTKHRSPKETLRHFSIFFPASGATRMDAGVPTGGEPPLPPPGATNIKKKPDMWHLKNMQTIQNPLARSRWAKARTTERGGVGAEKVTEDGPGYPTKRLR